MALVLNDRVYETSSSTGTGTFTLAGAPSSFQTFAAGIGASNTTYYAIQNTAANEFEVGLGTLDATGAILTRTTVYQSSNADAAVNFSAGTKNVFCTYPSGKSINYDAAGAVSLADTTFTGTVAVTPGTANGITYLNGSKQLVSGSALSYNGTTLAYSGTGMTLTPTTYTLGGTGTVTGEVIFNSSANSPLTVNNGVVGTPLANSVASFFDSVNSFSQLNYQNLSTGSSASTDFVATADNGTDTTFFVNFGINSSTYNLGTFTIAGANDGYLYSQSTNLAIGVATAGQAVKFFQGGTLAANEVARFAPTTNNLLVGTTSDGAGTSKVRVAGVVESTTGGFKFPNGTTQTFAANTYSAFINLGTTPIQSYSYSITDANAVTTNNIQITPSAKATGNIVALGAITGGSAYTNGTYTNVPLTGGAGTGAVATSVTVSVGAITAVTIAANGTGTNYAYGDVLSVAAVDVGGTGSGFSVPVALLAAGGDELEMDGINVSAVCTTNGTISVYVNATPGYIAGGRSFVYTLG
jgi:hypothetical protein